MVHFRYHVNVSLSPLFFLLMKGKKGYIMWLVLFLMSLLVIDYVKRDVLSEETFLKYQWIPQIPAFLIGMLVAKLRELEKNMVSVFILLTILSTPFLNTLTVAYWRFMFLPGILYRLSFLVLFAFICLI